ncbi:hypothetical protein O0I10_011284 [Lichtheimia ornata]|uniref:PLC-like phosphodiesterase n=1 Tax=Lichtheimia ornata TaxID=688661 RepID=A0AAD7UT20_9FUNG|nr:uncharacterized protein O0I10_011284 [Lichtheimia ornata]KAJ8653064.1 hypothetical protein O0I10_011284 [Lichtheimia ornata]
MFIRTSFLSALLLGSISLVSGQQQCNGYSEFCSKPYNELTYVLTHNSYAYAANPASTQMCAITSQLADGVRALKLSAVKAENSSSSMNLCHTSCSILDAGPATDTLSKIASWLKDNPDEVLSIFWNIPNHDFQASDFQSPYQSSGLLDYAHVQDANNYTWPTLGEMISSGKRLVNYVESGADQASVPWLHPEFSYNFQTPYENSNASDFSCTIDRPSDPSNPSEMMYGMNHYLYGNLPMGSNTIQVPQSGSANKTNSEGSLLAQAQECTQTFGRAPNFLIVDFYNRGQTLQIAAQLNNVTFQNTTALQCDAQNTASDDSTGASATLVAAPFVTALFSVAVVMTFL